MEHEWSEVSGSREQEVECRIVNGCDRRAG